MIRFPAWLAADHPIAQRELARWRRGAGIWRALLVPLALLPCACASLCSLSVVAAAPSGSVTAEQMGLIALIVYLGLWALNGILTWALNIFTTIVAATLIAREREAQNWAMLKVSIVPAPEIVGAKVAALLRRMRWAIAGVLALRVGAVLLTFVGVIVLISAAPLNGALPDDMLRSMLWTGSAIGGVLFLLYSVVELFAGIGYNCAVGLLASSFSRTSAAAVGAAFVLHLVLWLFVFTPAQQLVFPLFTIGGANVAPNLSLAAVTIAAAVVSAIIPLAVEIVLAGMAALVALEQANRIVE